MHVPLSSFSFSRPVCSTILPRITPPPKQLLFSPSLLAERPDQIQGQHSLYIYARRSWNVLYALQGNLRRRSTVLVCVKPQGVTWMSLVEFSTLGLKSGNTKYARRGHVHRLPERLR